MRKSDWIKLILILSLLGNVALIMNQMRDSRRQDIKYELLYAYIYRDLSQLEATIQNQQENNWENETLVTQKLDDAIDSILLAHGMEEEHTREDVLWKLCEYVNKFKYTDGDGALDVTLTNQQHADYVNLGERLRSSGWDYNVGYDRNWDHFVTKVNELIAE